MFTIFSRNFKYFCFFDFINYVIIIIIKQKKKYIYIFILKQIFKKPSKTFYKLIINITLFTYLFCKFDESQLEYNMIKNY